MTRAQILERWTARRDEWRRLRAQVDGGAIADEVLADLEAMDAGDGIVTLREASRRTGYTSDHLSRLIRDGKLLNYGRKHSPRVKVGECPVKVQRAPSLAVRHANAYHPEADARFLVSSRR